MKTSKSFDQSAIDPGCVVGLTVERLLCTNIDGGRRTIVLTHHQSIAIDIESRDHRRNKSQKDTHFETEAGKLAHVEHDKWKGANDRLNVRR